MSRKSAKIAALIEQCRGQDLPAHYLGYFECFNQQMFYEAHDVLEELWLAERHGPNYGFYKGLIQFAGAFVHLQKNRLRPAAALFRLSQTYLRHYLREHQRLDVAQVCACADAWIGELERDHFSSNPLAAKPAPRLELLPPN
jgi:predicted metal-dependent hydrolase